MSGRVVDVVVALLIAALAAAVAYREMSARFHCQNCVADLLYPCVRQLGYMPVPEALAKVPAYTAFWEQKLTSIPCDAVSGLPIVRIGQYWDVQKYMHAAQSAVMLFTGPRFQGFWIFLSMMYAMSAVSGYALCRLGMGRVASAAASVAWVYAPLHLHNLVTPADYAKAPFAIATLAVAGLLVTHSMSARATVTWAATGGVLAGIGIGFKPDLVVTAILVVVALVIFGTEPSERGRRARLPVVAVFVVATLIAAAPVLRAHFAAASGSLFPVQIIGGMSPGYDDTHAAPAIYDYGLLWDDSWVTFQINSYNQRVKGATSYANLQQPELTRAATDLLAAMYRTFPADLILRIFGAIVRVLDLVPYGIAAAAVAMAALFASNLRWGLFATFVLLGLVGYVSLVFQARHYFHLQIVPLWMLGFAAHHGVSRVIAAVREPRLPPLTPERRARARAGLAAIAVVAAVLVVALAGARAYQQRRVSALIEDYNHDNFIVPVLADQRTEGSRARLVVDWPNQVPSEGPAALALVSTYLVVGVTCHGPADAVIWRVYRSPSSWSHPFPVRCSEARGDWRVFLPVYESGPSWRFQGIEWVAGAGIDVGILGRISDPRRTPLMLALTLPPDWREAPLYHRFSWDAIRTPQRW